MGPFNDVMNRIDGWSLAKDLETDEPQSFFRREIASRFATVAIGAPIEITALAHNLFNVATNAIFIPAKIIVNTITCITGSDALDDIDETLPSIRSFLNAIYRVAAYAVGVFSTITLGFISPATNFRLHEALGLAENRREKNIQTAKVLTELANAIRAEQALKEAAVKWQAELIKIEQEKNAVEAAQKAVKEKAAADSAKKSTEANGQKASKYPVDNNNSKGLEIAIIKDSSTNITRESDLSAVLTISEALSISPTSEDSDPTEDTEIPVLTRMPEITTDDEVDAEIEDIEVAIAHTKPSAWYKPWTWRF